MKTIAWEEAYQIALRKHSKKAGGNVSIYVILVRGLGGGPCNQAHIFTEGYC